MKNKISIYLNMVIICLSLCVIMVGVYSLTSANLTISGSLGYVYHEKSITATAQNYSTTAGGILQSTATNLTISEPTYNSTYGSNIITITLPNDIYFKGAGWDAQHIEILVKVKNTENTAKSVTLLFDDMEGLGYTRKVIESAETIPENITTNHSSAIILSKGEQTTFRLTLKQSIRKTNLAVLKDKLNIQLSVADYQTSSLPTASTGTKIIDNITYTINADQNAWSATSSSVTGDVTITPLIQGLPVNNINGLEMVDSRNSDCTLTIPNSVTDISKCVIDECMIKKVKLPGSLINICDDAFWNAEGYTRELISVNYIYNFETIGQRSFKCVDNITELELQSEELTSIGYETFSACDKLISITIPSSVTSIGNYAFFLCNSLLEVVNKSNLTITAGSSDNGYVAYYAKGVITDISQSKFTKNETDGYCVYNESSTSKILLAFTGTQTTFEVPSSITAIHNYAFSSCSGLTSITIPSSVTSIGNYAFYSCSNLSTVTLNTGLKTIGNCAFEYCSGLTSITIPSSVTSIGNSAFSSCWNLSTVTFQSTTPPTFGSSYVFSSCSALTAIKVPSSAVTAYKNVSNLSSYKDKIQAS